MTSNCLIENDIFFDKDIISLLLFVNNSNGMNDRFIPIQISEELFCLFDTKISTIINTYQSALTKNSLEKHREIQTFFNKHKIIDASFDYFDSKEASIKDIESCNSDKFVYKCAIVDIDQYDIRKIKKGHKQNILKSIKDGANVEIYHSKEVPEDVMKDFYESILFSRKNVGKKFLHSDETFLIRGMLIKSGKAVLSVASFCGKKSYVFSLVSKYNSFYYDSGYTSNEFPHIGHYAQHSLIEYLKSLGCKYYNLGKIDNIDNTNIGTKKERVEYYKSGFCQSLTDVTKISMIGQISDNRNETFLNSLNTKITTITL